MIVGIHITIGVFFFSAAAAFTSETNELFFLSRCFN